MNFAGQNDLVGRIRRTPAKLHWLDFMHIHGLADKSSLSADNAIGFIGHFSSSFVLCTLAV